MQGILALFFFLETPAPKNKRFRGTFDNSIGYVYQAKHVPRRWGKLLKKTARTSYSVSSTLSPLTPRAAPAVLVWPTGFCHLIPASPCPIPPPPPPPPNRENFGWARAGRIPRSTRFDSRPGSGARSRSRFTPRLMPWHRWSRYCYSTSKDTSILVRKYWLPVYQTLATWYSGRSLLTEAQTEWEKERTWPASLFSLKIGVWCISFVCVCFVSCFPFLFCTTGSFLSFFLLQA